MDKPEHFSQFSVLICFIEHASVFMLMNELCISNPLRLSTKNKH